MGGRRVGGGAGQGACVRQSACVCQSNACGPAPSEPQSNFLTSGTSASEIDMTSLKRRGPNTALDGGAGDSEQMARLLEQMNDSNNEMGGQSKDKETEQLFDNYSASRG